MTSDADIVAGLRSQIGAAYVITDEADAEHAIGITNRAWLLRDRGPVQLASMRQIKQVFDPHGLMNPGKLFV